MIVIVLDCNLESHAVAAAPLLSRENFRLPRTIGSLLIVPAKRQTQSRLRLDAATEEMPLELMTPAGSPSNPFWAIIVHTIVLKWCETIG